MPHSSQFVDATIHTLGGLGDGVATVDGKPLYVPKSCVGDQLRVMIVKDNKEARHGRIEAVREAGADRQPAPCPHFDACGGCSLQQLKPEAYRAFKQRLLDEALSWAGFAGTPAPIHFLPAASRRRVDFKLHHGTDGLSLAFYRDHSHELVPVSTCLILHPTLHALIAPLTKALSALAGAEQFTAISLTAADKGIDATLGCRTFSPPAAALTAIAKQLGIARIHVVVGRNKPAASVAREPVQMVLGGYEVDLPPHAFLQATAQGQKLLTDLALDATRSATSVVDLFSGIGTYALPASKHAKVLAVEGDALMARALQKTIKKEGILSLQTSTRDLFKRPLHAESLKGVDAVIINPPRAGAKAQVEQVAASAVNTVVMISCNPATFARDAALLRAGGFSLKSAMGVDQFAYSTHLEIAAVFRR